MPHFEGRDEIAGLVFLAGEPTVQVLRYDAAINAVLLEKTSPGDRILATDLHSGNVLRAQRRPWLAIAPKLFVGDPAYDLTQHLLNCPARMRSRALEMIQRVADLAAVDGERIRRWLIVRLAIDPDVLPGFPCPE